MTDTHLIWFLTIVVVLVLCQMSMTILAAVFAWRCISTLMWFHQAGRGMAEHQLEKARLDLRGQELEIERVRVETAMIKGNTPGGNHARRIPDNVVEVPPNA